MALTSISFNEAFNTRSTQCRIISASAVGFVITLVLFILGLTNNWSNVACQVCNPVLGACYGAISGIIISFVVASFHYHKDRTLQREGVTSPGTNPAEEHYNQL